MAAAILRAVGAAAASAAAAVMATAGDDKVAHPTARKRHRGSGASARGSGASNGTNASARIASGWRRGELGREVGAEACMAAKEHRSNRGQRAGPLEYDTSELFGLLPRASAEEEGAAPAPPPVPFAALQVGASAATSAATAQRVARKRVEAEAVAALTRALGREFDLRPNTPKQPTHLLRPSRCHRR